MKCGVRRKVVAAFGEFFRICQISGSMPQLLNHSPHVNENSQVTRVPGNIGEAPQWENLSEKGDALPRSPLFPWMHMNHKSNRNIL